jgi:uncharacterized protein (TIGR02145 family)
MKKKITILIYPFCIICVLLLIASSCAKDEKISDPAVPVLTTIIVSNISQTTATSGGNVTSQGSSSVADRGICWSATQMPSISDTHTSDGSGTGSFSSNLSLLTTNTTYYVRAYATNSAGTGYGNQESFTTQQISGGTVTDIDGNLYHTITIGTQVWLVENLKTTRYNDGASIPLITESSAWGNLDTPGYCWYDNDAANKDTYGSLYNWFAVNNGNLAPAGWHVPTDAEWTMLTTFLGGESIAGGKLKETGWSHWRTPNAGATNESGFTALPAGHRDINGTFSAMDDDGYWWSVSEYGTTGKAWYRNMNYNYAGVVSVSSNKKNGHSVRCIKDSGGFTIGQNYGGGIIFYIDSTGQHGLISASSDQITGAAWGCYLTYIGGTSIEVGTGQANTTAIINGCTEPGIAARVCNDLELNGYSDWFLPSLYELEQMALEKSVIGGFTNENYISSSELDEYQNYGVNFANGQGYAYLKSNQTFYLRAVRTF